MLGVSGLFMGDGDASAAVVESGGASGGSSEVGPSTLAVGGGMDENERSGGGGNRWPRQETLALLKIRSDMDVAFRDASLKGPLWEEVSRKMAELGFQRSSKKCKEKFENVYKYHKRTKDGRASKPDGKTYRFFDQLTALENTLPNHLSPPPPRPQPPATTTAAPLSPPLNATNVPLPTSHVTVSSTSPTPLSVVPPNTLTNIINSSSFQPSQPPLIQPPIPISPVTNSTSSSTSSDEDIQRRRGRKRKWKDYFERLMKDVIQKQEELQKKFLETLERRDRDRIGREEAWRVQEKARMNREYERLIQERSTAAARDAAVIAFLQKVTGEHSMQITLNNNAIQKMPMQIQALPEDPQPPPPPPQPEQPTLPPPAAHPAQPILITTPTKNMKASQRDNSGDDVISASSSRWPKTEIEALIKLRTGLEVKYQDNGPKGPLWEEISNSMADLGYNRSAKRCKEKWENINKYFKKVKESNKKRPEDAKTCPYFHQLDAIYKEKAKNNVPSFSPMKLGNPMVPIMARPEQQWPAPALHERDHDNDSENNDHGDDEDEEDEDEIGEYEIIANNKQPSSVTNAVE